MNKTAKILLVIIVAPIVFMIGATEPHLVQAIQEQVTTSYDAFYTWVLVVTGIIIILSIIYWGFQKIKSENLIKKERQADINRLYFECSELKDEILESDEQYMLEIPLVPLNEESIPILLKTKDTLIDRRDFINDINDVKTELFDDLVEQLNFVTNEIDAIHGYCSSAFENDIKKTSEALARPKVKYVEYTEEYFKYIKGVRYLVNEHILRINKRNVLIASILEHFEKMDDIKLAFQNKFEVYFQEIEALKNLKVGDKSNFGNDVEADLNIALELIFTSLENAVSGLKENKEDYADTLYQTYLDDSIKLEYLLDKPREFLRDYEYAVTESTKLIDKIYNHFSEIEDELFTNGIKSERETSRGKLHDKFEEVLSIKIVDVIDYHDKLKDIDNKVEGLLSLIKNDYSEKIAAVERLKNLKKLEN